MVSVPAFAGGLDDSSTQTRDWMRGRKCVFGSYLECAIVGGDTDARLNTFALNVFGATAQITHTALIEHDDAALADPHSALPELIVERKTLARLDDDGRRVGGLRPDLGDLAAQLSRRPQRLAKCE